MTEDNELSYDDITEIRRVEMNSGILTRIRPDFYQAANRMLKQNNEARNKLLVENPDMYDGINSRYRKLSTMLEDIIRFRSNKIWCSALRCAPTGKPVIPENITEEEKRLFDAVFAIAKEQFALMSTEKTTFTPDIEHAHEISKEEPPAEVKHESVVPTSAETPVDAIPPISTEEEKEFGEPPILVSMEDTMIQDEEVIVRVLSDVPTFSGPERDYTLKKEDVVRLPSIMASALINRKMAVLVKTTV